MRLYKLIKEQYTGLMIILGVDPGMAETGFGVIKCQKEELKLVDKGNIKTPKEKDQADRLYSIFQQTTQVIRDHKPEILVIESLFFNVNAKSASAVGQAIGVIKLAAAKKKIKVIEYPPLKIKRVLTENGRAEKKQIQSCVRKILRLRKLPRPTHAADALAVAICHWQTTGGKIKTERR